MSQILTISGWAQKPDSLLKALPAGMHAAYVDYLPCADFAEMAATLLPAHAGANVVMGWSLGAQLAVRAVAAGYLKPKLLVLFSPPYQYVNGGGIECGSPKILFKAFTQGFRLTPVKILNHFAQNMIGEEHPLSGVFETIEQDPTRLKQWVRWLKILGDFSCDTLDLSAFPRTLIFHNRLDPITPSAQSELFLKELGNARLTFVELKGHAPHLQAPEQVQAILREELANVL